MQGRYVRSILNSGYIKVMEKVVIVFSIELWHEVFNSIEKRVGRFIVVDEKINKTKSTLVEKKCMELDLEDGL